MNYPRSRAYYVEVANGDPHTIPKLKFRSRAAKQACFSLSTTTLSFTKSIPNFLYLREELERDIFLKSHTALKMVCLSTWKARTTVIVGC